MGYKDNKFLNAYYNNIGLQVEAAIESSPVGTKIVKFIEDKQEWEGTATKPLNDLEPIANELKLTSMVSYDLGTGSAHYELDTDGTDYIIAVFDSFGCHSIQKDQ